VINLHKTRFQTTREYAVQTGQEFAEIGMCAQFVVEDGVQVLRPSGGVANERFAGVTIKDNEDLETKAYVEEVTVPSSSPYTVQLTKTNLVASNIKIYDDTNTQLLSEGNPATTANEFSVVDSTGIVTFHSGQAGATCTVTYRYQPTVAENKQTEWERTPNQTASDEYAQVAVAFGPGTYFETDQFDASLDYSPVTVGGQSVPAYVTMGAGGLFTTGGNVTVGTVAQVPSVDSMWLGVLLD